MIQRPEHKFADIPGVDVAFLATHTTHRLNGTEPPPQPTTVVEAEDVAAYAYVNHNRWVAECPWCESAQLCSPADPRFFCTSCENAAVAGAYVMTIWPAPDMLADVEAALLVRPLPSTRHWYPDETVESLIAENEAHRDEFDLPPVRVRGRSIPKGANPGVM